MGRAEGADKPASVTEVEAKAAGTSAAGQANAQTAPKTSNLPLYLSIAALIVCVLALIVSLVKKKMNVTKVTSNSSK